MHRKALLLSVRPVFVEKLLAGTKTVELRRIRPRVETGQSVLIYGTSPRMALLAHATVHMIEVAEPPMLWERVREAAGLTWNEYRRYFRGTKQAVGIWLTDVIALDRQLSLYELRERWPWFQPPQSFRFLEARVEGPVPRVTHLAPGLSTTRTAFTEGA